MSIDNDLIPCPFCGGKAEIATIGRNAAKIKCLKCHITKTQRVFRFTQEWLIERMYKDWNKRI